MPRKSRCQIGLARSRLSLSLALRLDLLHYPNPLANFSNNSHSNFTARTGASLTGLRTTFEDPTPPPHRLKLRFDNQHRQSRRPSPPPPQHTDHNRRLKSNSLGRSVVCNAKSKMRAHLGAMEKTAERETTGRKMAAIPRLFCVHY